jgi:hypothetical protein
MQGRTCTNVNENCPRAVTPPGQQIEWQHTLPVERKSIIHFDMSKRSSKRQYPNDPATTPLLAGQPQPSKSSPVSASKTIAFNSQAHLASTAVPTTDHYHTFPQDTPPAVRAKPKQPNRTTKTSQKLKLFPEEDEQTLITVDDLDASVYDQIAQIPHGTARLEAERLSKIDRGHLPRVTAYCTAS